MSGSPKDQDAGRDDNPTSGKIVALAVAGAVGGFLFGFDSSVINGAVDAIQSDFELSSAVVGLAVASALIGCAVGAYAGGKIADRWGRIVTMVVGAVLFLLSSLGSGFAFGPWDLVVWRVVGGLGIGIASVVAPAYIAEISPKQSRGRLTALQQLAITVGIFTALLSDALFQRGSGSAEGDFWFGLDTWRWMFLAGAVPAVIYGVIALRLPESPRYLVLSGRVDDARNVLDRLWHGEQVDAGIADIQKSIDQDRASDRSGALRGDLLGLRPVIWVGICLSVLQQFVGINVIFYYSTSLWQAVGFDEDDSFTISVITALTNILVTLIAIALVDKVGRKPLLLVGSIGMAISLGAMALSFANATMVDGQPELSGAWGPIALVGANLFVIFFGATWGPLVWVLLGEIFPNSIRARGLGIGAGAQWIANFIVSVSFPVLSELSLSLTYGGYAFFALVSLVFVWKVVPETKGMALEDADSLVMGGARS
jgi:SP family sugar:H+ symporter-like MFS transporter